jgi:VanZ family protein
MSDTDPGVTAASGTVSNGRSRQSAKQRFLANTAPLAAWLALMITVSSLPGDALPEVPVWNADKLAHAAEYLVLALLVFRYLRLGRRLLFSHSWQLTAAMTVVYAALDELHQLFIPNRLCDWHDFAADCSGIMVGVWLAMRLYRRRALR